jgi:hypothetical protein
MSTAVGNELEILLCRSEMFGHSTKSFDSTLRSISIGNFCKLKIKSSSFGVIRVGKQKLVLGSHQSLRIAKTSSVIRHPDVWQIE